MFRNVAQINFLLLISGIDDFHRKQHQLPDEWPDEASSEMMGIILSIEFFLVPL